MIKSGVLDELFKIGKCIVCNTKSVSIVHAETKLMANMNLTMVWLLCGKAFSTKLHHLILLYPLTSQKILGNL